MPDRRNPYISETGRPLMRRSVVSFLDILGYQQMIKKAQENGKSQEFLDHLYVTLKSAVKRLHDPLGEENDVFRSPILTKDLHRVVTFTDNIVLAYPIEDNDGESELGMIVSQVADFQLTLAKAGFFVRGAIAIGTLFIDNYLVFGQGLLDAYNAEKNMARDPRIVLTKKTQESVRSHLNYYANPDEAPQVREFFRDSDGQYFVNYLERTMIAEYELGPPDDESVINHKNAVETKLDEYLSEPSLWSKYSWVAHYHNYFCDLCPYFSDEHKIDLNRFQIRPSLIV